MIVAAGSISLIDFIRQNNVHVEPFIREALVPALSDNGLAPPLMFRQADDKVFYVLSPLKRYNKKVLESLHERQTRVKYMDKLKLGLLYLLFNSQTGTLQKVFH